MTGWAEVKPYRGPLCFRHLAEIVPGKVPFLEQILLFHERQDLNTPGSPAAVSILMNPAARKLVKGLVIIVDGQTNLFQVVGALDPIRALAHFLNRGKQQSEQHRDDGDDHEQFDQRKGSVLLQEVS